MLTDVSGSWALFESEGDPVDTRIVMDDDTAWRLFTKNISERAAIDRMRVSGDRELGELIARTVSFMK